MVPRDSGLPPMVATPCKPFINSTAFPVLGTSCLALLGLQSRLGDDFGTNYLEFDWCVPKTGLEF